MPPNPSSETDQPGLSKGNIAHVSPSLLFVYSKVIFLMGISRLFHRRSSHKVQWYTKLLTRLSRYISQVQAKTGQTVDSRLDLLNVTEKARC
jgi:hypothetical protein